MAIIIIIIIMIIPIIIMVIMAIIMPIIIMSNIHHSNSIEYLFHYCDIRTSLSGQKLIQIVVADALKDRLNP